MWHCLHHSVKIGDGTILGFQGTSLACQCAIHLPEYYAEEWIAFTSPSTMSECLELLLPSLTDAFTYRDIHFMPEEGETRKLKYFPRTLPPIWGPVIAVEGSIPGSSMIIVQLANYHTLAVQWLHCASDKIYNMGALSTNVVEDSRGGADLGISASKVIGIPNAPLPSKRAEYLGR